MYCIHVYNSSYSMFINDSSSSNNNFILFTLPLPVTNMWENVQMVLDDVFLFLFCCFCFFPFFCCLTALWQSNKLLVHIDVRVCACSISSSVNFIMAVNTLTWPLTWNTKKVTKRNYEKWKWSERMCALCLCRAVCLCIGICMNKIWTCICGNFYGNTHI